MALIVFVLNRLCWAAENPAVVDPAPREHAATTESIQPDAAEPEPRFVAPTRRDRIGRIWAPVVINGKGPFRLVLDTGATQSAVTAAVALALGLPVQDSAQVLLHGVTGSATVPTIPIDGMAVGDLFLSSRRLAIVANALGGADGVLGTEGLLDKRITIDFRHDSITIARSRMERAGFRFIKVPFRLVNGLPVADAQIGGVLAKAVIDTGGEGTIGNVALREALMRRNYREVVLPDGIVGITLDVQSGNRIDAPPITIGGLALQNVRITTGDMEIFKEWGMTRAPVLLVGMDVLGLFDVLIIDYRLRELQARLGHDS
ncbi:MAG TPA: retropepsin-like aspartic protease [Rudaea sp.]|nr:retropepsin-like aspartic protease [Rudaea sp.]